MMGLETLGAGPVSVVGAGAEELVLLSFVVALVGSDAFAYGPTGGMDTFP